MICADLECLVSSHDQSCLAIFLVLEQSNITSASLLPFPRVPVELEELSTHLEDLFLRLLVGLSLDLLGQSDHRFEFDVGLFLVGFVLSQDARSVCIHIPRDQGSLTSSSSFFALELPLGSSFPSSSSSAFLSFLGPPPNMEKTDSFTPDAAAVAELAALLAALAAASVTVVDLEVGAGASDEESPKGFLAKLVSCSASLGSEEAVWSAEEVGLASVASDMVVGYGVTDQNGDWKMLESNGDGSNVEYAKETN